MGRQKKSEAAKRVDRLIGERIRDAREALHLSQGALAERLQLVWKGIEGAYISKLERGERSLRLSQLALIAKALDIPLSQLIPPELSVD